MQDDKCFFLFVACDFMLASVLPAKISEMPSEFIVLLKKYVVRLDVWLVFGLFAF